MPPTLQTPSPLVITMGDAAGIGPEIIVKAFRDAPQMLQGSFVAGDVETLRRAARAVFRPGEPALPVAVIDAPEQALQMPPRCVPVLQVGEPLPDMAWGRINAQAGAFAAQSVQWAAHAALQNRVRAIVTAPLHKEAMSAAGAPFDRFPGHTELLQDSAAKFFGKSISDMPVRMMLANDALRVVLVSIHVSLLHALSAVTFDNVLETIRIGHHSLVKVLGRVPRIAVAGLNPHAGEGGLFGREEIDVIAPAIAAARSLGCTVSGPWAPDTVFMRARQGPGKPGEFDLVVAMYHDQGLIPVKYLGIDEGVNVTLGLPLVRTSPDHGTAFDLAGSGRADASSLLAAIRMAQALSATISPSHSSDVH
ncbi:MAG: 4-hydroxythreonine-4-phosphate dehydrogenase PdxA [Rhodoferax sp.]|nr:4-hydroxythreonine-4-phosphate dehydrogenase PdxA [Rhodoferax sp.]MCF8208437.1 4-hydroxythreonine-4-phosphate dehydrogenase PdxA [Rhodoferax sp.]